MQSTNEIKQIRSSSEIAIGNDNGRVFLCSLMTSVKTLRLVLTEGVSDLKSKSKADLYKLMDLVATFKFSGVNDSNPYGENDFGTIKTDSGKFFFKFDYYDLDFQYGADPYTDRDFARVLTILRADEF